MPILLFLAVLFFGTSHCIIHVEHSGILAVNDESYAIQFYMTVANDGKSKLTVSSKKPRCCWKVEEGDIDCDSMVLIGGNEVVISPKSTDNITFIFPTIYPMDRVGNCHFILKAQSHLLKHNLLFNTTEPRKQVSWQDSLSGFDGGYKTCPGIDLDPRNDCKPVNCMDKYNGKRSFFEKKKGKCKPVHNCYTMMKDKELPEIAFDKDHNNCKSLVSDKLTAKQEKFLHDKSDKSSLAKKRYTLEDVKEINPIPLDCHHGKRVGSVCVCDEGWGTDTSVVPNGDLRYIFHWCNLKILSKPTLTMRVQRSIMIAGLGLITFSLLIGWLIIIWGCFVASGHNDLPARELADKLESEKEFSDDELSDGSYSESYHFRYGVVHTSYDPREEDELCLKEGQRVTDVRDTKRKGWMKGTIDGIDGYFRTSHVMIYHEKESDED